MAVSDELFKVMIDAGFDKRYIRLDKKTEQEPVDTISFVEGVENNKNVYESTFYFDDANKSYIYEIRKDIKHYKMDGLYKFANNFNIQNVGGCMFFENVTAPDNQEHLYVTIRATYVGTIVLSQAVDMMAVAQSLAEKAFPKFIGAY